MSLHRTFGALIFADLPLKLNTEMIAHGFGAQIFCTIESSHAEFFLRSGHAWMKRWSLHCQATIGLRQSAED